MSGWALRRERRIVIGGAIVAAVTLVALVGPFVVPADPLAQDLIHRLAPPGTHGYPFGSDDFGRDVLSRVVWGARVSLLVGVAAVGTGLVVGSFLGLLAGFYGGWTDAAISRVVDVLLTFPAILLAIVIVAAAGASLQNVIIAIAMVNIPRFARVIRGSVLAVREQDFIVAAQALGVGHARMLALHVLPNVASPLIVFASLNIGAAILTEASLSFLGIGVAPPTPTWGTIVQSGSQYLERAPWVALSAGSAIMVTVLGFNVLGDGIRDVLDPRLRER